MPATGGDKEYALPIKGINTEANPLHFPEGFCVDALNLELHFNPQYLGIRSGVSQITDSSSGGQKTESNVSDHQLSMTQYLWEGVANNASDNFIVYQSGIYLYFFDLSDVGASGSPVVGTERFDLSTVLSGTSKGTVANLKSSPVDMQSIKGKLVVVHEAIDPIIVEYDSGSTSFTFTELTLKMRDTLGVEDELAVDKHPSTLSDDHKYNLLNQGWYKQRRLTAGSTTESDPITSYFTKWAEYPSNSDIVWLGMVDSTGDLIFDAEWLRDQTFGSTPAPRGHYVVDIFSIDRSFILANPLSSGSSTGGSSSSGGGPTTGPGGGTTTPGQSLP